MSNESNLVLLADGIAKLEDELAQATAGEDKSEIEALLELARETYAIIQARLDKRHKRRAQAYS